MKTWSRSIAVVSALALLLAACGSGGSAEATAFCDDYISVNAAVNAGPEEDPEAWITEVSDGLNALKADAPDAISGAVNGMADALLVPISTLDEEGFFAVTESDEYIADIGVINEFVASDCDVATIEVTAVDYAFNADLDSVDAGTTAFQFSNEGSEVHEMLLMRINDDVDASVEELLEMPQEESESMTEFVGVTFAGPGSSNTMYADLGEGRYVMLCFVPTGSTSMEDAETADGPPHFMNGMVREFTVGA